MPTGTERLMVEGRNRPEGRQKGLVEWYTGNNWVQKHTVPRFLSLQPSHPQATYRVTSDRQQ